MREKQFKALQFTGQWVDMNMLEKGIYTCEIPRLYSKDATMDMLVHQAEIMKDMTGDRFVTQSYFDNLKKCELVDIEII